MRSLCAEPLERRDLLASDVFIGSDGVLTSYTRTVVGNEVTYSPVTDSAQISQVQISADLSSGRTVIIDTINLPGTQAGDVRFTGASLSVAGLVDATLEVRADNDISIESSNLSASPGTLTFVLNSDRDSLFAVGDTHAS